MSTRSTLAVLSWSASLLAVASLSVAGAWGQLLPSAILVVTAVLPMVAVAVLSRLGVSRWLSAVVLTALLVVLAYLLAAPGESPFARTLLDAVPRLLTEPRPLTVRADLLLAPVLLVGLISVLVGLSLERRSRAAAVLSAVGVYVGGLLLTAGAGDPWGLIAVLMLVLAVSGWVFLDDGSERPVQRLAVAAPVCAIAAGVLASLALIPTADGYDPGESVHPPLVEVVTTSPMPQLGAWAANPDAELLRVSGDPVPLRLVTLDSYDGTQWSAATRYAPFGSPGDPSLPPGPLQRRFQNTVTVTGLGGNWLPSPGRPSTVSGRDALVDPETGTLLAPDSGEATPGTGSYDVAGVIDDFSTASLVSASVPDDARVDRYLDGPELPFALDAYGSLITEGTDTPYERALAIEDAVKNERSFSAKAISGSAYWRITAFLLGKKGEPGARIGTSEQFATAFALLARQNGLPTRLVVGFKAGDPQPDGTRVVRGSDALAWPEVYFEGIGWVPFSPSPNDDTFARDRPVRTEGPERTMGPLETEEAEPTPPPGPDTSTAPEVTSSGTGRWLLYAAIGGLFGLPLLMLAAARATRRRRHRRQGLQGVWADVLDALTLAKVPVASHESASGVAGRIDEHFGVHVTARLATAAERAAFGPDRFVHVSWSRDSSGDVRTLRRTLRRTLPWWRRWWWTFDPRVLGR